MSEESLEAVTSGQCLTDSPTVQDAMKCGCHSFQSDFKGGFVGPCEMQFVNNKVYASGNLSNSIIEFDKESESFTHHYLPTRLSVPMGTSSQGNTIYYGSMLAGNVGEFSINDESFTEVSIDGLSSGIVDVARGGNETWFSEMVGGDIGRVVDGEIEKLSIPDRLPALRGIEVVEDKVIVAASKTNKIYKIDRESFSIDTFVQFPDNMANPVDLHLLDNKIYTTHGVGDVVSVVNFDDMSINRAIDMPAGSKPSRIDSDSNNNIWLTLILGNKLAKIDLDNNDEVSLFNIELPLSSPEGIAVDDEDTVWFVMWSADRIAKFDQDTEEISKFRVPGAPLISADPNTADIVWGRLSNNISQVTKLIRRPFVVSPDVVSFTDRLNPSDVESVIVAIGVGLNEYAKLGNQEDAVMKLMNELPERKDPVSGQKVFIGPSGWAAVLDIVITTGILQGIKRWINLLISVANGWLKHSLDP